MICRVREPDDGRSGSDYRVGLRGRQGICRCGRTVSLVAEGKAPLGQEALGVDMTQHEVVERQLQVFRAAG